MKKLWSDGNIRLRLSVMPRSAWPKNGVAEV